MPLPLNSLSDLLGIVLVNEADIVKLSRKGVSVRSFHRLQNRISFPLSLIGPETSVRRCLKECKVFGPRESECLIRLARTTAKTIDLLGEEQAKIWLHQPFQWSHKAPPFPPLALIAESDTGARLIETRILQTAHGIY